jgi:phosphate transport system substrate-binding protein
MVENIDDRQMIKLAKMLPHGLTATLLIMGTNLVGCSNNNSVDNNQTLALKDAVLIKGAGATFPAPLYQRWIQEYTSGQNNVTIDYESVGSGSGVKKFLAQEVDFGASDAPLNKEETDKFPSTRGKFIQVPMTGGLLVFAYNLSNYDGLDNIRLSRSTYCDIVTGKIKTWNDPAIVKDNPTIKLPNIPLIFVNRKDSSGTTFIFTNHLAQACANWDKGVSKKIEWEVGLPADGNEGVSTAIQQTQGTIGYIEYSYSQSKNLQTATLENKAGQFISPSPENASNAFLNTTVPDDFALVIPDPEGENAYPIVGLTWLLIYGNYQNTNTTAVMKNFVQWSLTNGDKIASEIGYLPLPEELQNQVISHLNSNLN